MFYLPVVQKKLPARKAPARKVNAKRVPCGAVFGH
jgi:hypothetical protein